MPSLWVWTVLMTACGPLAVAEASARGLADDKAVAAFYQPDEVQ